MLISSVPDTSAVPNFTSDPNFNSNFGLFSITYFARLKLKVSLKPENTLANLGKSHPYKSDLNSI